MRVGLSKKLFIWFLLPLFLIQNTALANSGITIEAKLLNRIQAEQQFDSKLLGKYKPVELTIINNSGFSIKLPEKIYFKDNNIVYSMPDNTKIYDKTKRHLVRRAAIWCLIGGGLLSFFTTPASIAHTQFNNQKLQDCIIKNNYRHKLLFDKEKYSTYIFIPKKLNIDTVLAKDISLYNGKTIDIESKVQQNLL